MLNSPTLSIFQHFHAIPLRSPLISLRSKWRLTGFSRRFTPKNPVRLHNPFGELPRWGAKNVLPLNLIAFPTRGRLCVGDTAFLIQPPPLRGTSFHRKEGESTRAPSLGRGCRAQRGGVGFLFLRRSRLLFAFPHWGRGTALAVDRVLSLIVDLRCIFSRSFIPLEPYPVGDTRETCHPQTFGHRPIYICGEAATTTLNPEP